MIVGIMVATLAFRGREPLEANVVRLPGTPYTREGGTIRNGFELHLVNKQGEPAIIDIEAPDGADLAFTIPVPTVELEPLANRRVPFFVTMDQSKFQADRSFTLRIRARTATGKTAEHEARAVFLGARQ